MGNAQRTPLERFWSYVEKSPEPDGCWLWTGTSANGYPRFWTGSKYDGGHRFSYEVFVGPLAAGMFVLHRCDIKRCVRPDHLFAGTHAENMADRNVKGRQAHSGRCGRVRLTVEQVREIRHALATLPMAPTGKRFGQRGPGLRTVLARRYGVSTLTIWKIGRRSQWPYVE